MLPDLVTELLAELEGIATDARQAYDRLNSGEAQSGITALRDIAWRAEDAVRHAHGRAADIVVTTTPATRAKAVA